MRVVVSEFISLGGVVQAPGGPDEDTRISRIAWLYPHAAGRSEALLQGRRTYQVSATAGPERSGKFADWINGAQKYVVSDTLPASTTSPQDNRP